LLGGFKIVLSLYINLTPLPPLQEWRGGGIKKRGASPPS
jgi:hypothetical protein